MICKQKKVILAGAIGNALEWYDFTIYAFFVPIIAKQFFPNKDLFLSLIATLGVFAVGFLVRPLGAVLFGFIGDHGGRLKALKVSMVMMSFPTFCMGLLPNYDQIGLAAPLLLILLRIVQGLAVSGELTTATVFLIEHADNSKRGIAGSMAMSGAFGGIILSAVVASLISGLVSDSYLSTWGWRIPFLLGGLIGIVGFIIRYYSSDPAVFLTLSDCRSEKKSVVNHIGSLNYRILLMGVFLTSLMATANYFLIGYFNTFLVENQSLPLRTVMIINTIALAIQAVVTLCTGYISDHIGRKPLLAFGILGLVFLGYPIFWLLTQHEIILALIGESLFAICSGALTGALPTTLAEMFDTYHRNTGISLSYNLALALFGGTAPLIAVTLVANTNNVYAPLWYLMLCAALALFTLLKLKESYKHELI